MFLWSDVRCAQAAVPEPRLNGDTLKKMGVKTVMTGLEQNPADRETVAED